LNRVYPNHLTLDLLGHSILVRCCHKECLDGIQDYFSASVADPWCTPDIVVDCDLENADRYLFRTRPSDSSGPLEGVKVHSAGNLAKADWDFLNPPLPPFWIEPFRNRFVAIHSAAVAFGPHCVLIVGNRGAGKTTISTDLVNRFDGQLLTDETAVLHRRTSIVEPFPRAMGIVNTNGLKEMRPCTQVCRTIASNAALATHIVFLERVSKAPSGPCRLEGAQCFERLLEHQLDVGSSRIEATVTMAKLAHHSKSLLIGHDSFSELQSATETVKEFFCE